MSNIALCSRGLPVWSLVKPILVLPMLLIAMLGLRESAAAQEARLPLAIAEFSFADTSGETADRADHRERREIFASILHEQLEKSGKFSILKVECPAEACAVVDGVAPEPLIAAARQTGARYLVVGGVQKMSTLVQWARLGVLDLETRRAVVDRLYTFRGDTTDAWRHAALYVARHVTEGPAAR